MEHIINYIYENCTKLDKQMLHTLVTMLDKNHKSELHFRISKAALDDKITITEELQAELDYIEWQSDYRKPKKKAWEVNLPIEIYISDYISELRGGMAKARAQMRKRFIHCSFDEQVIIINAFMQSHKVSDILWCCKYLTEDLFWRPEYLQTLLDIWDTHKDNYQLMKVLVQRADHEFFEKAVSCLNAGIERERRVRILPVLELAKDGNRNLMDFNLNPRDYLYVAAKTDRTVAKETVLEGLYYYISLVKETYLVRQYLPWTIKEDGEIVVQVKDELLMWSIAKLGAADALIEFHEWLEGVIALARTRCRVDDPESDLDLESDFDTLLFDALHTQFPENFGYLLCE